MRFLFLFLTFALSSFASASNLKLEFSPESDKFIEATKDYQKIWDKDGQKILSTMEKTSGLKFQQKEIKVIVYEGISFSGYKSRPMKMRASYSFDVKKGTLIHELGHRLIEGIPFSKEVDNHRALFLFLNDVWIELYGKVFADKLVKVESGRKGVYDYEGSWKWALSMGKESRNSKLAELRVARDLKMAFEKFNKAFREADAKVLTKLLTEDYFHTNGSGSIVNKIGWLAYIEKRKGDLDSGKLKVDSYSAKRVRVKIYGDTGVITAIIQVKGFRDKKAFNSKIRVTTLWVKQNGKWKRATFHDSRVPE